MVKHIVMWKLRDFESGQERQEAAKKIQSGLQALVGKVDGLLRAEVGINFNPAGYDLCLYTELRDRAALDFYQGHPEHLKMKEYIHTVITERVVCDWEC